MADQTATTRKSSRNSVPTRVPSDLWSDLDSEWAVKEQEAKDRRDKNIPEPPTSDVDSDDGNDGSDAESGSGDTQELSGEESDDVDGEDEDEEGSPVRQMGTLTPETTPTLTSASLLASTTPPATKETTKHPQSTSTDTSIPPPSPSSPPHPPTPPQSTTKSILDPTKQMSWCIMSRAALIRAETVTFRATDFHAFCAKNGLPDTLQNSKKPTRVLAVFQKLLKFDEIYMNIRSRFDNISVDSIRSKLSSIKNTKIGKLHRPADEDGREAVKEKFKLENPKLLDEIHIYDLLCHADDKRKGAMIISDTAETADDTAARLATRKRSREEALIEIQNQKLTQVEKRRMVESEAKKKVTQSLRDMSESVEKRTLLHEAAEATNAMLAARTVAAMDDNQKLQHQQVQLQHQQVQLQHQQVQILASIAESLKNLAARTLPRESTDTSNKPTSPFIAFPCVGEQGRNSSTLSTMPASDSAAASASGQSGPSASFGV